MIEMCERIRQTFTLNVQGLHVTTLKSSIMFAPHACTHHARLSLSHTQVQLSLSHASQLTGLLTCIHTSCKSLSFSCKCSR
jgi:hypothetical protein